MDREAARQEVRAAWETILDLELPEAERRVNGHTSYICPFCGHGSHGDGLTVNPRSYDGNGLKCFSCGFSGDVIDLIQKRDGKTYSQALTDLADDLGIIVDDYGPSYGAASADDFLELPEEQASGNVNAHPEKKPATGAPAAPQGDDLTAYYNECRKRINDPAAASYLLARGISPATAAAYWVGYDPAADPGEKGHPCPRIIIPTSKEHYVGRRIDGGEQYKKMNRRGTSPAIFNQQALFAQGVQEVFVTEGAFDALSILEVGAAAIALNSTSNTDLLLKVLSKRKTAATLILCLDQDEAGEKAAATLRAGLQRMNISHITADICQGCKDPNEALVQNREAFTEAVQEAQRRTAARPDNTSYYIDNLMAGEIQQFKAVAGTGFSNLDKCTGGLYPGLYAVAATSSLGKTTFCLQLADQLAEAGQDVIFFSLEQSRLELVSKSLARRTAQADMRKAVTSLQIRRRYLPEQVLKAAREYQAAVRDRLAIVEGNFSCNLSFIGDYIRQHIRRNGTRPIVFIDYLQILQPEQVGGRTQTTKETVDATITELRRISRELGLTIFAISSVNRASYLTPVDFESLKESGSIEYTCDVIYGLQLEILDEPIFSKPKGDIIKKRALVKQAKAETPRRIKLVCLKNRYGISSFSCSFNYYPANDLFTVDDETTAPGMRAAKRFAQE